MFQKNGATALILIAECGYTAACETLIKHGANLDIADENGYAAIHAAAANGHAETVELLLNKGANIHSRENNGRTALHSKESLYPMCLSDHQDYTPTPLEFDRLYSNALIDTQQDTLLPYHAHQTSERNNQADDIEVERSEDSHRLTQQS